MDRLLKKDKKILIVTVIILIFFSIIKKVYVFEFKYNEESNIKIRAMVEKIEKLTEDKISYLIKYDGNKFLLNIYDYEVKDTSYNYGDVIEFRGNIEKKKKMGNPYEFDYKRYLNSNNIVTTITSNSDIKYIGKSNGNILFKFCYSLKGCINDRIEKIIPEREANLYKSMIYGEDLYLDEDIKENFKKNGMSHILAVSGIHFMYLVLILDFIFKKSGIRKCKIIYYIVISCYLIISGLGISSIRAGIMCILLISSKKNEDNVDNLKRKYINIAISYILLLIYNPYVIFNVSGIFSYLATLGIITFNSIIYSFFEVILKVPKCTLGIFKILSTAISSLIMLFPVQIYYFGIIELRLILSCVLTSMFISYIYIIGFISLFFSFVPIVSDILFNSIYTLLHILIKLFNYISKVPIPTIHLPKPSLFEIYIYYISLFLFVINKYTTLINRGNIKKIVRNFILIFGIFSFVIIISMCIYRIYFEEYVIYFNVGQGNMSLIRKNRKVILIDSGSTTKNLASNILNNFLNSKAIDEIDLVLITHMHTDHMNGIYGIDAKIKKIGYSIPKEESKEFNELIKYIDENKISKVELKKGDNISFKNITLSILLPYANKTIKSNDIANSNSIVTLVTINKKNKDINLLYMGDATVETENVLIKNIDKNLEEKLKNISILQLGHHGSKTSTSDNFLNILEVKLVVISSKKKLYGHPAKETLDKLSKYNIEYKITENDNAIVIKL